MKNVFFLANAKENCALMGKNIIDDRWDSCYITASCCQNVYFDSFLLILNAWEKAPLPYFQSANKRKDRSWKATTSMQLARFRFRCWRVEERNQIWKIQPIVARLLLSSVWLTEQIRFCESFQHRRAISVYYPLNEKSCFLFSKQKRKTDKNMNWCCCVWTSTTLAEEITSLRTIFCVYIRKILQSVLY